MHRLDEATVIPAREIFPLINAAFREWRRDQSPRLAAALSFYALFTVAPLLLIAIVIAGFVFGEKAARGEIVATVQNLVGYTAGRAIEKIIRSAGESDRGGAFATLFGFALLLLGASGAVNHLKESLNTIWGIPTKSGGGFLRLVRRRFLSMAMVLAVGLLLLGSLVAGAVLADAGEYVRGHLAGGATIWQFIYVTASLVVITFLFALLFRYIPDTRIAWRDVWMGAAFTSILFTLGKFLIGLYLGRSTIASTWGAAGAVVVVLVWIYYSSLIVFFGAEFTEVYARRRREGADAARHRSHRDELLVRAATERPAARSHRRSSGGKVTPIVTGCAGLLVGLLLGILSTVLGVFVTAARSVVKKFTR